MSVLKSILSNSSRLSVSSRRPEDELTFQYFVIFLAVFFSFFQLSDAWLQTEKEIGERYDNASKI